MLFGIKFECPPRRHVFGIAYSTVPARVPSMDPQQVVRVLCAAEAVECETPQLLGFMLVHAMAHGPDEVLPGRAASGRKRTTEQQAAKAYPHLAFAFREIVQHVQYLFEHEFDVIAGRRAILAVQPKYRQLRNSVARAWGSVRSREVVASANLRVPVACFGS